MYYFKNPADSNINESEKAMKAQQQKTAETLLTKEFVGLITRDTDESTTWGSSLCDLIEIAHIAYMQGTVCKENGCPCSFQELVTAACTATHMRKPSNPYAYALRASRRKGMRACSFLERYIRQPSLFRESLIR
ncbi:MAG: hypothetical protein ACI4TW_02165 [Prevotella sp.]